MAKELSLDEEDGFSLTSTLRRHMEMLMLLDDILVLSSLSRKRQRIWYCMPESHMDLEVYMRDSFPQGSSQLLYDHRGLRRLTEDDGKSYPGSRERDSHSHENPTQRRLSEDGHSPLERTYLLVIEIIYNLMLL